MCGIAGWIDYQEDLKEQGKVASDMSETLKDRGPDAGGIYAESSALLIHRRLIVIDPENGKQPMTETFEGRTFTLIYNGELYNTEDIRAELLEKGHRFRGHSDTEVLLHAFMEWEEDCFSRFNGIFAFAVWEHDRKKLWLVRDRMGVKPLFFYPYSGGLLFGSTIRTLLANPLVKPHIAEEGLKEIFLLGPGRTGGNGIIKGVRELKPGEYAVFDRDGLRVRKYWMLKAREHTDSLDATVEKTRFLITDSIQKQLVSDVPLCCFLSGGLDSSIISKIASDHYRENGNTLTTYSVDYTDNDKYFTKSVFQPGADMEYIGIMVDAIESDHRPVILDNAALAAALPEASVARNLPGMADIDSSLLLFCREIKKDFTVALSGECADELFGGYPWYHNREILFDDCFPWSRSLDARKKVIRPGLFSDPDDFVYQRYADTVNSTDTLAGDSREEARMRQMFMLNLYWFMQTLLDRKDRMSMACGLEVRVPFCDHRIVEYAYNMPWHMKSLEGREKGIVRQAMEGILPERILWRKKSPYPKTHNPLFMRLVSEGVEKIRKDPSSPINQLIDWEGVADIREHPERLTSPWYGQLMGAPQVLAYLIQMDTWFREFHISIV